MVWQVKLFRNASEIHHLLQHFYVYCQTIQITLDVPMFCFVFLNCELLLIPKNNSKFDGSEAISNLFFPNMISKQIYGAFPETDTCKTDTMTVNSELLIPAVCV